ncbi:MAG TPA: hypothetical protein VLG50_08660 [Candidatus Saccharimonadales bacterium]|nr:hypothetical protein [Candidatus Saccharimonadales bacterium]
MDYRFNSYNNFFIVFMVLASDCFLQGSQDNSGSRIRQRSPDACMVLPCPQNSAQGSVLPFGHRSQELKAPIKFCDSSGSLATSFGSLSRDVSPDVSPNVSSQSSYMDDSASCNVERMSVYSMVGNKSFEPSTQYHALGYFNHLLEEQSSEILTDFCQTAGITLQDLYNKVFELQRKFPETYQFHSIPSACPIQRFFASHGYGNKIITIKKEDGWGNPIAITSCKGITIYPSFFRLSEESRQTILHTELQHIIHRDNFYKHVMGQIVQECGHPRARYKLQAIVKQYDDFIKRRADLKAGISAGDIVINVLAQDSHYALTAPVNYMEEVQRMIEQERKAPVIIAWIKECEKYRQDRQVEFERMQVQEFSDSDDDFGSDAEEFNNRLQFTSTDF